MLGASILDAFKLRFAWWAVELALPGKTELRRRFRSGLLGVLAAVAGGVIVALAIAGLLAGGGFALYQFAGFTVVQSVAVSLGSFVLVAVGLLFAGISWLEGIFQAPSRPSIPEEDVLKEMLNGFIEGLLKEPATQYEKSEATLHTRKAA